jgi:3-oxoacyl-[acyl-carrier protein] reductase
MDSELAGKTVLVTGASGGIGSAIARSFAAEGAKVVLHYHRNRASAAALLREFRPGQAIAFGADLTKQAPVKKLFAAAGKHFGGVDVLVANAGDWEMRDVPVHQKELKQWQATFDGVLTSAFLCLREFLGMVEKQKRGNAVLIASTAGIFGEANHADYAAAKSAMAVGLLKSVKNEIARLAPHTRDYCGGRINCVCPGWTLVSRTAEKLRDPATARKVAATMALPKVARPEDIANAVTFFASDKLAGHVTGQTLVVAGGMEGRLLWRPEEIDPSIA